MELLKRVKTIKPAVKTLLISAFDVKDDLIGDRASVDKMLLKPIKINNLNEEVKNS